MIEDRVGELRLRIRTDLPDAAELRPAAKRLVGAALERCAALLEQRMPGRVVLMQRLPLRWRLDESMLDDAAQVEELARVVADAVEQRAVPAQLDPPVTGAVAVVFDDEAHFRASHLLALARGHPSWFHAALEDQQSADPLAALAAPERRAIAHATLLRLARDDVLADVLASQPAPAVAVLAAALGCAGRSRPSGRTGDVEGVNATLAGRLADIASRWPALTRPARTLALRVHAAVLLETDVAAPEVMALAAIQQRQPGIEPAPQGELAAARRSGADRLGVNDPVPVQRRDPPKESLPGTTAPAAPEGATCLATTRCAGLFYLLERVQELDLAESLWKVCLPEGAVLAAAASALLGPELASDGAAALFGGVEGPTVCPEVTSEQHQEVAVATAAALAAALPRRGLAELPFVFLTLADHPTGRLLVAAAEGSPFAFFAWPAAAPTYLQTGLRAFLDAWPHRGGLAASPSLVALDTSGRLRPNPGVGPPRWFLPEASSAPAAALLALVAGAPCLLFSARAGVPSTATAEAFVARYLARPGRIRLSPEAMDIILAMADIDMDLRWAGLDRDPGWLPWLRRRVHFVYEESEPEGVPSP